jgi:tetratricopeptide (TPR) repeat protein
MKRVVRGRCSVLTVTLALLVGVASGCQPEVVPDEPASAAVDPERERVTRFWQAMNAADAARMEERHAEAARHFRQALELDAQHGDALFLLGHSLSELSDYSGALSAWQELVRAHPDSNRGFTEIGVLRSSLVPGAPFDLEKSREAFEAAFRLNPEESGSLMRLGELDVVQVRQAEAQRRLDAVRRSNPQELGAPFLLGYLAREGGDADRALELLTEAASRATELAEVAPSFEGQTELGAAAMVRKGAHSRSLLGPFWLLWSSGARGQRPVAASDRVELAYHELDAFVAELGRSDLEAARQRRAAALVALDAQL